MDMSDGGLRGGGGDEQVHAACAQFFFFYHRHQTRCCIKSLRPVFFFFFFGCAFWHRPDLLCLPPASLMCFVFLSLTCVSCTSLFFHVLHREANSPSDDASAERSSTTLTTLRCKEKKKKKGRGTKKKKKAWCEKRILIWITTPITGRDLNELSNVLWDRAALLNAFAGGKKGHM